MQTPPLDRLIPTDFRHIAKYPLQAAPALYDRPVPVIAGTNWYGWMSEPRYDPSDRRWWIGRGITDWGRVEGGHCYVLKPEGVADLTSWWSWYDQGVEGKCVGFGCARAMTLVDRVKIDPHRIYTEAQKIDEWEGEDYSGTSVRAGLDILRRDGAAAVRGRKVGIPTLLHGVKANRWATTVDELYAVLDSPRLERQGAVALLNSWGRGYPHITYLAAERMQRLLDEYGEASCFTPA
jgi:hypothetical protein